MEAEEIIEPISQNREEQEDITSIIPNERVHIEEKFLGLNIQLESKLMRADVLLDLAMQTRERMLQTRSNGNRKEMLGV